MKKWNIYMLLALLILGACTDEENGVLPSPDPSGMTTLTLKFPQSSNYTKALSPTNENRVETLDVLVFTESATGTTLLDDEFAYRFKFSGTEITSSGTNGDTKQVSVKMENREEKQRIILLANLPAGTLSAADTTQGKTLEHVVSKLAYSGEAWQKDGLSAASDPAFPMWGQMATHQKFHHSVTTPVTALTINMIRAVARIDIGVNIGASDPSLGFGALFKIDSVYLCNTNDVGRIAPHSDYLKTAVGAAKDTIHVPYLPDNRTQTRVGYNFESTEATDNLMMRTIYATESGILDSPAGNQPAFLIVKATYYNDTFYYRVDFTQQDEYVPLLRNHRYLINIVNARAGGYNTLGEALGSKPSKTVQSLVIGEDDLDLNSIVTNEHYMLGVGTTDLRCGGRYLFKLPVRTSFPGGWKAEILADGGDGLSFRSASSSQTTDKGIIEILALQNPTTQTRKKTIKITAGTLTQYVVITQYAGSNSYIYNREGDPMQQMIHPSFLKADGSREMIEGLTSTNINERVSVAWRSNSLTNSVISFALNDDVIGDFEGESILVNYDESATGVIIVAVKDVTLTDTIATWPVWIVDYDPATTNLKSKDGLVFMDRNLFADSPSGSGLYFQWGRPHPFPAPIPEASADLSWKADTIFSDDNLEAALQHPFTFYYNFSFPYDWTGNASNNSLWNTIDGEKGAFDPCPAGWRVPRVDSRTSGSWSGFTPLGFGLIDGTTGLLSNQYKGYMWSAATQGMQSVIYDFTGSQHPMYRANALPVRCMKDN